MKKLALILIVISILSGCAFKYGDDLLVVPKPPKDYIALQKKLDKILATGAIYASPEFGKNRNTVQQVDIDADGEEEVISFFRQSPTSGKFTVYVHKKIGDEYIELGSVTGHGTDISSVTYPVLSADGARGIIICWSLGTGFEKGATVCSFENNRLRTILDFNYSDFVSFDLDGDHVEEILSVYTNSSGKKLATVYDYSDGRMHMRNEVSLSSLIKSISKVRVGNVVSNMPAVFIDSKPEGESGLLTDILVYTDDSLKNITIEDGSTESFTTRAIVVNSSDADGDGIVEIPKEVQSPRYNPDKPSESLFTIDWYSSDINGKFSKKTSTYHNLAEEWYFTLPEKFYGKVSVQKRVSEGINFTSFEEFRDLDSKDIPFLEIYTLTGDNKSYISKRDGMIILEETDTAIYCARIPETSLQSSLSLSEDEIERLFNRIQDDWLSS